MFCDDVIKALPAVEQFTRQYAGSNFSADIISEVKVKALELGFTQRTAKLETWLIEIAKNICKANFNQKCRSPLTFADLNPEQLNQYDYQPCRLFLADYYRKINRLPATERKILLLTIRGYKCREIAEKLNLKPQTVKTSLWKARHKLKGREY